MGPYKLYKTAEVGTWYD